ncbi:DUF4312 family protein [Enterococcus alishanensis]|uniref:DUF4312 family protein n=1 Tax=Enterococcus alishanensis TaxID=1303817 RepID=A0ABS6TCQ6_9ENTE|nr:DUF4312 family protein [Enterococcus alishanensis]MBV7390671.1 DUF4312 family protein [Enterococcus alishanensis]
MTAQKTTQKKVIVNGKGDSKQHAFAAALGEIQQKLMQESEVLLRVEPLEVEVLAATEQTFTERFLFFFFPRKRTNYQVQLAVTVEVSEIDLTLVPFMQEKIADPEGINLPFVSKKIKTN